MYINIFFKQFEHNVMINIIYKLKQVMIKMKVLVKKNNNNN